MSDIHDIHFFFSALTSEEDLCDVTSQNIFHVLAMSSVVNCDFYSRLKFRNTKRLLFIFI